MNRKPHIAHVIASLHSGGVQSVVLGMARSKSLSEFKHSVVCLYENYGNVAQDFVDAGVDIHECILPFTKWPNIPYRLRNLPTPLFKFQFRSMLKRLLKQINADIVHTHAPAFIDAQSQATVESDLPWVWTIHGFFNHKPKDIREWKSAINFAEKKRSHISTVSEAAKSDLIQKRVFTANDIDVIYPGTETSESITRLRNGTWRKAFGIPYEALVFGSVGRVSEEKGFDIALKAMSLLKQQLPHAYFLILGDGDPRASLETEAKRLEIQDRFFILGFNNHPLQFLQELDVFVLPSRLEAFGLALVEAMSIGLPCIAADVGGTKEILDETAGILIPPEDPDALADAMLRMASASFRDSFSGGPDLAKKFTHEICARNYLKVYERLLSL
jgi:glycosyltransferase involved in cell wall biosynthesis